MIGAGASGTLRRSTCFARRSPGHPDRARAEPGRGVAYGTRRPSICSTSPRPDDRLSRRSRRISPAGSSRAAEGPSDYAPRKLYGDYLAELLAGGRRPADRCRRGGRVDRGSAANAYGLPTAARSRPTVVLAPGNLQPATSAGSIRTRSATFYIADPWTGDRRGAGRADDVMLLGTGLTAIDAALCSTQRFSRSDLRDVAARPRPARRWRARAEGEPAATAAAASVAVRTVRGRTGAIGWRGAVHELRPSPRSRIAADDVPAPRFLRHLRPCWDAHRHRIAPAIQDGSTRCRRRRGTCASSRASAGGGGGRRTTPHASLRWRPRGGGP